MNVYNMRTFTVRIITITLKQESIIFYSNTKHKDTITTSYTESEADEHQLELRLPF